MRALATLLLCLMPAACATAPALAQPHAKLTLIWTVGTMTQQGPLLTDVPDTASFTDKAVCLAFGEVMTARMQDWIRGAVRADWDHPVAVKFRCEIAGQDS